AALQAFMEDAGVKFDHFVRWVTETERLDAADSFPSWADLPAEFCRSLTKDGRSINKCLIRCKTYADMAAA
ncbi:MAG: hypothetical protein ACTHLW_18095, partial [Verrucomicrobiota bacterium]